MAEDVRTIPAHGAKTVKAIVLVAPGVAPPLTEGRKLLVADLAETLRDRGMRVEVICGAPGASGAAAIRQVLQELDRHLRSGATSDAVVVFPWGTFRRLRRLGNAWLLKQTAAVCARFGVTSVPVFYSCVGLGFGELSRRFGPSVAVGRAGPGIRSIPLGVRRAVPEWQPRSPVLRDALFLCGYQKPTHRELRDALDVRGLADLLRAGSGLAAAGIRLSIAIPFLRNAVMRDRLLEHVRRLCPTLSVTLHDEVDAARAFADHDVFVFPYRAHHAVFIPTSLLEALMAGIPVVAADHVMYRSLTVGESGPRCSLHRVGDASDLAERLISMRDNYTIEVARAAQTAIHVRTEWNIEHCADELLVAVSRGGVGQNKPSS